MKAHDEAPVFPENTEVSVNVTDDGSCRISFTEAQVPEGFIVHEYKVVITDENNNEVYKDNFIASYYLINDETTQNFTVPKDTLTKDKIYTLTVTAESAYHKISEEKTVSFTVQ